MAPRGKKNKDPTVTTQITTAQKVLIIFTVTQQQQ